MEKKMKKVINLCLSNQFIPSILNTNYNLQHLKKSNKRKITFTLETKYTRNTILVLDQDWRAEVSENIKCGKERILEDDVKKQTNLTFTNREKVKIMRK